VGEKLFVHLSPSTMIDTILVLDTSGSMAGAKLKELKEAVLIFLATTKELDLGDRIAVVSFGQQAQIISPLSNSYDSVAGLVMRLTASGSTPMAEALVYALEELVNNGRVLSINEIQLMPRIILMTDGEPNNEAKTLAVAALIGKAGFPIACVGVTGCKQSLLQNITTLTGGMFVMTKKIQDLSAFFLQQVYLTLYIAQMKDQFENLLSRELLRAFFEQEMNCPIDDVTLDLIIIMLTSMAKGSGDSSRRFPSPTRYQEDRRLLTYDDSPRYNTKKSSSGCLCIIL